MLVLRRALVELAAGLEDRRTGCVAALTGVQPLAWDGGQVLRRWSRVGGGRDCQAGSLCRSAPRILCAAGAGVSQGHSTCADRHPWDDSRSGRIAQNRLFAGRERRRTLLALVTACKLEAPSCPPARCGLGGKGLASGHTGDVMASMSYTTLALASAFRSARILAAHLPQADIISHFTNPLSRRMSPVPCLFL